MYLHLDRDDEPWSVHLEIQVEGTIDEQRLTAAVREAALLHPIARARLADSRATDVRYHWEIHDELEHVPLQTVDCGADHAAVGRAREELLSRTPPLDRPGPFALLLAHRDDGDTLALNLHHAAGDGMSALRLMGSIARAYAGVEDPLPPIEPGEERDIRALAGAGSLGERLNRSRAALEYLVRGAAPPVRVAPDGGNGAPGYGFELLKLDRDEVERVLSHRRDGATVNDVLLGGLAVAIRKWNEQHDEPSGATYLMMPINLRPPEWRFEVVGNYASYVTVQIAGSDTADLDSAIAAAAARTRKIKENGIAGLIVDLYEMPAALPSGVKKRIQNLIPLTGNLVVDTAVLSNLGRLEGVPHLGDAGAVQAVWFSPPGRMPLGASFGTATRDDELFVTLRYRHALLDAAAANALAALYRQVLVG
jgi:NRPS condensation-like uncharacterized protein